MLCFHHLCGEMGGGGGGGGGGRNSKKAEIDGLVL